GSWPGELYFFKGLGKGKFAPGTTLKNKDGKDIRLGSASTVFAADWNGDGKLDLIIGNQAGQVQVMLNEGTDKKYVFSKATKISPDGAEIKVPDGHSGAVVADWDGDGKLDLIVGAGDGSVLFYRNIGTAKEPKLAAAETLVDSVERFG